MKYNQHQFVFALTCLCLGLGGFAGLVYQTAWARQFAQVFGTSEIAVAAILAIFMAGLALGAWIVNRLLNRIGKPLYVYGLLEFGIAISAIVVLPAVLALLEQLLIAVVGNQPAPPSAGSAGSTAFYIAGAFLALIIPTTLMGATLPLIVRVTVHTRQQIGRRVGLLYAFNTVGAVAGTLACAFMLLPNLGLSVTVWVAAGANVAAAIVAFMITGIPDSEYPVIGEAMLNARDPKIAADVTNPPISGKIVWVLPLVFLTGTISFLQEVMWTRLLAHLLGSSLHAFAIMLASFLSGIALGGAAGAYLGRERSIATFWFATSILLVAVSAAAAWFALQVWAPFGATTFTKASFCFALLLPLAFSIGLQYPLAVRMLSVDVQDAAASSARIYSWNAVGNIVGALLGAFVVIPVLRYEGTLQLVVVGSAVLAAFIYVISELPRRQAMVPAGLAVAFVFFVSPKIPAELLAPASVFTKGERDILYYEVGRSSDVVLVSNNGGLYLRSGGLPEAFLEQPGNVPELNGELWMAPLVVLARPQTENMLIIGYGGGGTIIETPPSVREIDVIEIEPKIIEANQFARRMRSDNPLVDNRVTIIENDARGALLLTEKTYDAVISQPSHPWTAGASHLHTRKFAAQIRQHLNPGGVFVQWSNLSILTEDLLRSMMATLLDVFAEVRLYRPDPSTLLFLASDQPIEPEVLMIQNRFQRLPDRMTRLGITAVEDLLAAIVLDTNAARRFAEGAKLITDDDNRLATRMISDSELRLTSQSAGVLLTEYDVLQRSDGVIYDQFKDVSWAYIGNYLSAFARIDTSIKERITGMAELLGDSDQAVYLSSLARSLPKTSVQIQQILPGAIDDHPGSDLLRFSVIEPWISNVAMGTASPALMKVAEGLSAEPASVLQAVRNALENNWGALAAQDELLGSVPSTAVWAATAAQLRVEWRLRVQNVDLVEELSREAIQIIDNQLVRFPNLQLLSLRAWCSERAAQPASALGSIALLTQRVVETKEQMGKDERASLKTTLQELLPLLEAIGKRGHADDSRLSEIRSQLLYTQKVL